MKAVIIAALVAFFVTIVAMPFAIKFFTRLKYGQPIREIGPKTHLSKKGTPTMGGVVFIFATVIAYIAGHLVFAISSPYRLGVPRGMTSTGVVLLGLLVGMGALGFIDDYLKIRRKNSVGLTERWKLVGQAVIAAGLGWVAVTVRSNTAEKELVIKPTVSFIRDLHWLDITKWGILALFIFVVIAMTNAVNLTDGLDGLASGASVMVLGAYTLIAFWEYRHWDLDPNYGGGPNGHLYYSYEVRDPLEIAVIAASAAAACFGFLWWNAAPAKIFMGDTGALGLGGLIAGMAFATRTVLLLPLLAVLFTIIAVTWSIQIGYFKLWHRRVFRMVPLHHHFELAGWSEVNIVVRFWIIAAIGVASALGLYYLDFLRVMEFVS